jgi:hypothetical protein
MRRSELLAVMVFCPHFERPVAASRNQATDRLVDCTAKDTCSRQESSSPDGDSRGVTITVYPQGCPVFRARA